VTGTVTGVTQGTLAGAFGGVGNYCVDASGTGGGSVVFAETYTGGTNYTFSMWLEVNTGGNNLNQAIMYGTGSGGAPNMLLKRNRNTDVAWLAGKYQHYVNLGTGTDMGAQPGTGGTDGWHHLVVMYDLNAGSGTDWHVYWDNVRISDDTWYNSDQGSITYSAVNLFDDLSAGNADWLGGIDEFAFYNRTLSADEIEWLYQNSISGLAVEPIPEPAALGLLGLGVLALRRRRS